MIQKLQDSRAALLGAVAIFAFGLTTSGYAFGDGLGVRSWQNTGRLRCAAFLSAMSPRTSRHGRCNFSTREPSLAPVQQSVDQQARAIRAFFERAGFRPREVTDSDVSLSREQLKDKEGNRSASRG